MLDIPRYNTWDHNVPGLIRQLHARTSLRGDVVSAAGRQKTIQVFGQPLTPAEVVQRICDDVRQDGMAAVLHYTAKLDGAVLSPDELRVSPCELQAAHQRTAPGSSWLPCAASRTTSAQFQSPL